MPNTPSEFTWPNVGFVGPEEFEVPIEEYPLGKAWRYGWKTYWPEDGKKYGDFWTLNECPGGATLVALQETCRAQAKKALERAYGHA